MSASVCAEMMMSWASSSLMASAHLLYVLVAGGGAGVVYVADVEYRFRGEQEHLFGALLLVIVLRYYGAGALSLFQCVFVAEQEFVLYFRHFISANFGYLLYTLDAVFYRIEVLELEFGIDDFLVAHRIYASVHVRCCRCRSNAAHG